jgi:hypothetical protein
LKSKEYKRKKCLDFLVAPSIESQGLTCRSGHYELWDKYQNRTLSEDHGIDYNFRVALKRYVSIPCLCPYFKCPSNMSHSVVSHSAGVKKLLKVAKSLQ